jgi:hypothetical protein
VRARHYKHEVRVLDTGDLEARCLVNGELCWQGSPQPQSDVGTARAHVAAVAQLEEHVKATGHKQFKHRHGGPR